MPLFFEPQSIVVGFPPKVANALFNAQADCGDRRVTPDLALSLIKRHLLPLIPPEHHEPALTLGKPTWHRLSFLMPAYVFAGREHGCAELIAIGSAMGAIFEFSRHPPRSPQYSDVAEVSAFLLVYDQLQSPLREACGGTEAGACELYQFCAYCWRRSAAGKSLCDHHAVDGERSSASTARYQAGRRLLGAFERQRDAMLTREILEFHERDMEVGVIFPDQGLWAWLCERRPHVAEEVQVRAAPWSDEPLVDHIIERLHTFKGPTLTTRQAYDAVNARFRRQPVLLWPLLLRAEAWLAVRNQRRANWGGRRNQLTGV